MIILKKKGGDTNLAWDILKGKQAGSLRKSLGAEQPPGGARQAGETTGMLICLKCPRCREDFLSAVKGTEGCKLERRWVID